ncbi:sugar transferase [Micromonospora zingiberis]|uniref:Sugar transferase n=2 Tax=Micromonospora zingiberis TaxID=2053011 RepID=A0A4V2LV15_9ACTN|nr:sugar transferase [Micromonospora zingiberis]
MSRQPVVGYPATSVPDTVGATVPGERSTTAESDDDGEPASPADPGEVRPTPAGNGDKARPGLEVTAVLPYPGSRTSTRTRGLRAWMLTAPVDVAALLSPLLVSQQYWRGTLTMTGLTVAIFAAGGLYHARRHVSILDELPSLCGRLLASSAIVVIIAALRHDSPQYLVGFIRGMAIAAVLVLAGRLLTREIATLARRQRWVEHNAIIIGSGPTAVELARLLRRYPRYGLRFVGHVDSPSPATSSPVPVIGTLDQLEHLVRLTECDVLIIADPACPELVLMEILRQPRVANCDLWAAPRLWGSRSHGDHIGAIPIVQVGDTTLSGPHWALKRASDVIFAGLAMLLLSPILVLCAVLAFVDGGRGIFFRQERIGRHGKPFDIIKFRTMRPLDEHESQTNWSIANDRRVSPIGRFLRRTSLDELPQLWNILKGDMSVVGPRPERPYFVEKFSAEYPSYAMRHRVPVGLTGLAQVSGLRGDTPISDRARFDNYYIENWSLWLDAKVLLRTVAEVFRGGGR